MAPPLPTGILAQNVGSIFFWSLLLIGLLLAAFVVALIVRRQTTGRPDAPATNFTLADLRRMRESGELTEEQFQKLRQTIIGTAKADRS